MPRDYFAALEYVNNNKGIWLTEICVIRKNKAGSYEMVLNEVYPKIYTSLESILKGLKSGDIHIPEYDECVIELRLVCSDTVYCYQLLNNVSDNPDNWFDFRELPWSSIEYMLTHNVEFSSLWKEFVNSFESVPSWHAFYDKYKDSFDKTREVSIEPNLTLSQINTKATLEF